MYNRSSQIENSGASAPVPYRARDAARGNTPRHFTGPALAGRDSRSNVPSFAQLCAIFQDCVRAHPNVTDAKDAALTVLARRRLEVDAPTLNRAIDAVLEQAYRSSTGERRADTPRCDPCRPRVVPSAGDSGQVIDYAQVARALTRAGLVSQTDAVAARCECGHGLDAHHDPNGRPVSRYCRVVGCGCGQYRARPTSTRWQR